MMNIRTEKNQGYSTIEATIALSAFILAVMFIYSQIKVVIGENIMQNAVNSMAKETASYIYILDKLGLILDHDEDDNKDINALIGSGKNAVDDVVDFTGNFFDGDGTSGDDMVGALKTFIDELKKDGGDFVNNLNSVDKDDVKNALVNGGENAVKKLSNTVLSGYYEARLDRYLPMERDKFCRYFNIDIPESGSAFSFTASRVFPTVDCDSVLVAVSYQTASPFKFINVKRKICKYAYTAAWVSSNTNQIKKQEDGK